MHDEVCKELPDDHPMRAWKRELRLEGINKCHEIQLIMEERHTGISVSLNEPKTGRLQGEVLMVKDKRRKPDSNLRVALWLALDSQETGANGFPEWSIAIKDATCGAYGDNPHGLVWELLERHVDKLKLAGMDMEVWEQERYVGRSRGDWSKVLSTCGVHGLWVGFEEGSL